MLELGGGVMCVFAVIFLFYTNSFLIRRRKKEFGLYNILGMGKRQYRPGAAYGKRCWWRPVHDGDRAGRAACRVSKLAELVLVNTHARQRRPSPFTVSSPVHCCITAAVFWRDLRAAAAQRASASCALPAPLHLLRSESAGEKPPRANWVLAMLGLASLPAALYYLAVTVQGAPDGAWCCSLWR